MKARRGAMTAAVLFGLAAAGAAQAASRLPVTFDPNGGGVDIVRDGRAAQIIADRNDYPVVGHAVADLAADIRRVAGEGGGAQAPTRPARIIVGTLGRSAPVDRLVRSRHVDVAAIRSGWERFLVEALPARGGEPATLLIAGSDRRGTAYGVYTLSEAMGVSPWVWWADVPPARHARIGVPFGTAYSDAPAVRYRGLFINDEDWGLWPWAARTFDPARGNIGPRTYEKVFQLLLRLKANLLWPAMHKVSMPFNADPANARLADSYAIVMGSSHAEPMLRDNVGEWTAPAADFDYARNPAGVRAYWEERVRTNARYENLWTVGMRGIHDSGMAGADGLGDRVALLERVMADQRAMLALTVPAGQDRQVFSPYKEVLDLYRGGLKVADDVTILWPDDNFGYIRQFPSAAERRRPGGAGIYYHLSYLGAPLSYLWLYTTPPALVQEELTRAWDAGARELWVANAGDIKPGEIGLSLFFDLAWNVEAARGRTQRAWLEEWAGRTFGVAQAGAIGSLLDEHYRLNFERRPEHLQTWLPGEQPRYASASAVEVDGRYTLSSAAVDARLARFARLAAASTAAASTLRRDQADGFFELVDYPVQAAAAANRRFFGTERYNSFIDTLPAIARAAGSAAVSADGELKSLTARYNAIAGGKWRDIMAEEPADTQWRQFRLSPVALPAPGLVGNAPSLAPLGAAGRDDGTIVAQAEDGAPSPRWRLVEGLGRGRGTMMADGAGAALAIDLAVPEGPPRSLILDLLPTYPDGAADDVTHLSIAIDGAAPQAIAVAHPVDGDAWKQGVLDNLLAVPVAGRLAPGSHRIIVTAGTGGVGLDQVRLVPPRAQTH